MFSLSKNVLVLCKKCFLALFFRNLALKTPFFTYFNHFVINITSS